MKTRTKSWKESSFGTLTKLLMLLVTTSSFLISCSGSGDSAVTGSSAVSANSSIATDTSATSFEQVVDASNPSAIGSAATTDPRWKREARDNKWKPGYATTPAEIPKDKIGVVEKSFQSQAAGNGQAPVVMGETVRVAPSLTTIPLDANIKGTWSNVYDWPLIPIHLTMMPDGRLMSYGTDSAGRQTGKTIYDIFDPTLGLANGHMTIPKNTLADIFCSASIFLSTTNQVLTVGGDNFDPVSGYPLNTGNNSSTLFTPSTNTLVAANNMKLPRWYATTTTLLNGTVLVNGGLGGEAYPELRQLNGVFKALTTAKTQNLDYWYPRNWVNSDGRIFGYDSYGNYYYINTAGTGTLTIINQWDVNRFGEAGSAAMFSPGKILQLASYSNMASVIDISGATPILTPTTNMAQQRQDVTATVLPNGKVLATGGSVVYNELSGVTYTADTWDPATGGWTTGAAGTMARLYHSVAMLMPDGTVLVGGGGAWGPLNNTNVEFYYPSYLFNSGGQLATRPIVTAAPTVTDIGATFKLTVDDSAAPVTRITMVKTGAVTHGLNMEQNFNDLNFTRIGNELTVQMPTKASDATPGNYMVFALTQGGTPSQARIMKVNVTGSLPIAPKSLTGSFVSGTGVNLSWTQSTSANIVTNTIERSATAAGPFIQVASVAARKTYTDPNSTAGTYYYRVMAVNNARISSTASNVATVIVNNYPPPTIPGAPANLSAGSTNLQVNLSWIQGSGAVSNNIISRSLTSAGPFTTVATIAAGLSYTDTTPSAGTYYYQVKASNAVGASTGSNVASVTTISSPPPTLAAPASLSGYSCGVGCWTTDTGVRFNWGLVSNATGYIVSRSTVGLSGPWTLVATLGSTTTYVDKNVTNGANYYYSVKATGTSGAVSLVSILPYGITSNITLAPASTQANATANPATPMSGQVVTLSGAASTVASGRTLVGYEWTLTNGGGIVSGFNGAINQVTAAVTPSAAGSFSVSLKVTDNLGGVSSFLLTVAVTSAGQAGPFAIQSQDQTQYLVMNWWRGDPLVEGPNRQPGICTGIPPTGNCFLGARKTFRPMAFNIATTPAAVAGLIMMDAPQFESGVKSYDHYRLPVEFLKNGCTFKVQHVRTHSNTEFPLNPPGLEILDHQFTLTQTLCNSYPTGAMTQTWLNSLNTALTTYLGSKVAYAPDAYPYNDPRTGLDPSQ